MCTSHGSGHTLQAHLPVRAHEWRPLPSRNALLLLASAPSFHRRPCERELGEEVLYALCMSRADSSCMQESLNASSQGRSRVRVIRHRGGIQRRVNSTHTRHNITRCPSYCAIAFEALDTFTSLPSKSTVVASYTFGQALPLNKAVANRTPKSPHCCVHTETQLAYSVCSVDHLLIANFSAERSDQGLGD